jgi:hypothetical protein
METSLVLDLEEAALAQASQLMCVASLVAELDW